MIIENQFLNNIFITNTYNSKTLWKPWLNKRKISSTQRISSDNTKQYAIGHE